VVALVVLCVDAAGGIVRGHVTVSGNDGAGALASEAVVFVDSLPPQTARAWGRRGRTPRVTQAHGRFIPRVLATEAGTTVQFQNRDEVYHNVFSVSEAKHFDLGKYPPQAVNQVTFGHPGVVPIFCDLHPGEAGWIMVFPHRFFSQPARNGSFELPWLPAGRYTVHLWHPTLGEVTRVVEVPPRGDVTLALSF
jgi:plastocyanin